MTMKIVEENRIIKADVERLASAEDPKQLCEAAAQLEADMVFLGFYDAAGIE